MPSSAAAADQVAPLASAAPAAAPTLVDVSAATLSPPLRPGLAPDPVSDAPSAVLEAIELTPAVSVIRVLPPARPAFPWTRAPAPTLAAAPAVDLPQPETPSDPAPPTATAPLFGSVFGNAAATVPARTAAPGGGGRDHLDHLIAHHAKLNGVPADLVHRIVVRESRYNPRAVGRGGAMGLMQIKTGTARALGYEGGPAGLLDAETNLTYAVKYLAGAYRVAGGDQSRAVGHYARGYYYEARRQGLTRVADPSPGRSDPRRDAADALPRANSPAAAFVQPVIRPDENR